MKEITQDLGHGISLTRITEPKFTTNTLMVMMLVPVVPEKNAAYALAQSLLTQSCRRYPDNASMTIRLDEMYGASLNSSLSINGGVMQILISGSVIANRYALAGEDLLGDMTDLLLGCLFDPNVRDGAFDAGEYRIQRKELLDAIDAMINNKRGYALVRARQIAFRGEPDAYLVYGTREDVEKLDPASVYEAYLDLLRRAVIRVYCVGPEPCDGLPERLQEAFGKLTDRAPEALPYEAPSKPKPAPESFTEPMEVTQSKLVLAFKGENLPYEAFRLFSAVYGGTPFSMLFSNVREKMSLCYYCASRVIAGKNTLIVDSGVELANAEKAHEAILAQLDAMRRGEFSEELLENAKHSMVNSLRGIGDTPSSCISDAYERFYRPDGADVEERVQRYLSLTREDIIAVANALTEDTVYLMQQGGVHDGT
ncbi:MAG: insulinase family protein [Oscillospiraceae bacterium]|nr:insulinase family protein [Oscillospiraceae bacterium]